MRKTKIICTQGPAIDNEETLRRMIEGGMDCARFNFSHGTHEEQKLRMDRVKKLSREMGVPVALLLDTKGPEIRLRLFENGAAELEAGNEFVLTPEEVPGTAARASVTYAHLARYLQEGARVLIDDGKIELEVLDTAGDDVVCRVINGGRVSNRKSINIPDVEIPMLYVSETDRRDILFGVEQGVDYIAASFVRTGEDVRDVKKLLLGHGGENIKVIAKIENMQGIRNADEIIAESDGIMVARGDMGVEVEFARLPAIQKELIKKCYHAGKLVIIATQMLESMTKNPRPTRAEISDVANAVYDGTTAVMLSGESAAGDYPAESVKAMADIVAATEPHIDYEQRFLRYRPESGKRDFADIIARTACLAAHDLDAAAIIVLTRSGKSAELISQCHPKCPIIAAVVDEQGARQLNLYFGVTPVHATEQESSDQLFTYAVDIAKATGKVKIGDTVVIVAGASLKKGNPSNMLKLYQVK